MATFFGFPAHQPEALFKEHAYRKSSYFFLLIELFFKITPHPSQPPTALT
jgi:hypothetical protein